MKKKMENITKIEKEEIIQSIIEINKTTFMTEFGILGALAGFMLYNVDIGKSIYVGYLVGILIGMAFYIFSKRKNIIIK